MYLTQMVIHLLLVASLQFSAHVFRLSHTSATIHSARVFVYMNHASIHTFLTHNNSTCAHMYP